MHNEKIEALLLEASSVSCEKVADEVLSWAVANVEDYVDNQQTLFRLYFVPDGMAETPELLKLSKLYTAIPEDDSERVCMKAFDEITAKIFGLMQANVTVLEKLFKRLIYYYEMTGFSSVTGPIIQNLSGYVSIEDFAYEPIEMRVSVRSGTERQSDGSATDNTKKILRETMIPEGFAFAIKLTFWRETKEASLY